MLNLRQLPINLLAIRPILLLIFVGIEANLTFGSGDFLAFNAAGELMIFPLDPSCPKVSLKLRARIDQMSLLEA
jgi:hypothetical protein